MHKIIIANWKEHPATLAEASELFKAEIESAQKYPAVKTVICPPFIFIKELSKLLRPITYHPSPITYHPSPTLGAQDISEDVLGLCVSHVLVGHSDRRYGAGETDEIVNQKLKSALTQNITPILLVGEKEKTDSRENTLEKQLTRGLEGLALEQINRILIAYEPVWAISTSADATACSPEHAVSAIQFIQRFITHTYNSPSITCLYGGSVNSENIKSFLEHPEISGAVLGAASLKSDEFEEILRVAA